jgi:hypothetical protein
MKLISTDKLTQKKRHELAASARKMRPNACYRREFAQLTQCRRELHQNRSARRNSNA